VRQRDFSYIGREMVNPRPGSNRCTSCGSDSLQTLYTVRDSNRRSTGEVFSIARCRTCGISQTLPQPAKERIASYYTEDYYPASAGGPQARRSQLEKLALVRKTSTSGRLLDIGTGVGLFLREAQEAGFSAEGVEISATTAALGRDQLGVEIHTGDFLTIPLSPSSYDIVTLWHSLEHFHQPREVLGKIARLLKPGGRVVIAVPNINSLQARLFRSRWYHLDVPRHLFHFTPDTLTALLRDAGFTVSSVHFASGEHNWGGILGSVMRLSPPSESLLHKATRKLIGKPVAQILARVENALYQGGTFVVTASRTVPDKR
jgi:SAM-dependent methyltransferase